MIEQTTFLGMPLHTARQRRLLVVLYYTFLLGLLAFGMRFHKSLPGALVAQTFVLGGLFGGIRAGGLVKPYREPKLPLSGDDLDGTPITLNLSGRSPRTWGRFPWSPLDEREREQVNHAHFVAYRILSSGMCVAAAAGVLGMIWAPAWMAHAAPLLLWVCIVVALSLPQSVLLWTEPNEPAGELVALSPLSH